jgi:cytochrome c oxidase assembly protein subunit 15
VFFLPYLYFLARKKLERRLAWQLGGTFLLGALQGVMGWYMVKSGLVDDPKVNPVRLTMHLGLALAIFSAELWLAMQLLSRRHEFNPLALAIPILVFAMALSGGMVAGLRAGYAYNTFPLMNGHLVPPEVLLLEPWWRNFLYNMATVQFVHRAFFWILFVLIGMAWWRGRHSLAGNVLLVAFVVQAALGISTLLAGVPVALGAAHQGGAVLLLGAALWSAHSGNTHSAVHRQPARNAQHLTRDEVGVVAREEDDRAGQVFRLP